MQSRTKNGRYTFVKSPKLKCKNCKKPFTVWPSRIKEGGGIHCSRECAYESLKGSDIGTKHGMFKTRFYRIWCQMKNRCSLNWKKPHKNYAARGIRVCDEWKSFEGFKKDMYKSYLKSVSIHGEKNTSIDRINNDGNYEPKNCKWSTFLEQQKNTRRVVRITYKGRTKVLSDWSRILGVTPSYAYYHAKKRNMSPSEVIINLLKKHIA